MQLLQSQNSIMQNQLCRLKTQLYSLLYQNQYFHNNQSKYKILLSLQNLFYILEIQLKIQPETLKRELENIKMNILNNKYLKELLKSLQKLSFILKEQPIMLQNIFLSLQNDLSTLSNTQSLQSLQSLQNHFQYQFQLILFNPEQALPLEWLELLLLYQYQYQQKECNVDKFLSLQHKLQSLQILLEIQPTSIKDKLMIIQDQLFSLENSLNNNILNELHTLNNDLQKEHHFVIL